MNKILEVLKGAIDVWIVLFKFAPISVSVLFIWNMGFILSMLRGNTFLSSLIWGIKLKKDALSVNQEEENK